MNKVAWPRSDSGGLLERYRAGSPAKSPTDILTRRVTARLTPNDLQLWKLLEGREVESGLGEEALEEAGLVLHPTEPGLDQHGQLAYVLLDQVGQRSLQNRPDRLSRFAAVQGSLNKGM